MAVRGRPARGCAGQNPQRRPLGGRRERETGADGQEQDRGDHDRNDVAQKAESGTCEMDGAVAPNQQSLARGVSSQAARWCG